MGQADPSLGDGTLAPYPGLAATLAHGMDFFDRPSGVVIPQFASSLSASLGGLSSEGAQTSQASADQGDAAPPPITSSRDYDRFSDPLATSSPAANAYGQFSQAVASGPRSVGGPFSDAVTSSQAGPGTPDDSSGPAASDGAPRNIGRLFPDAVASSQVGAGAQSDPVWDPFGEVAASAPAGQAIGSFVDQAKVGLGPSFEDFRNYLSNSEDSLAQIRRDMTGYAGDLADNPIGFLRQAGPTFTGLGFSIPMVGVGASTGAATLRGAPAAAEETSALAAPSKALLSRGVATAQEAGGLANEAQLATEAAQGNATEGGVGTVDTFSPEEISAPDAGATPPALRFMKKWDAEARTKAETKLANLGKLGGRRMPDLPRPSRSAADIWRADGRAIPPGHDIDHVVDLQLGGSHTLDNMQPLPSSVNRSLGPQIAHRIKNLPIGTFIKKWTIGD